MSQQKSSVKVCSWRGQSLQSQVIRLVIIIRCRGKITLRKVVVLYLLLYICVQSFSLRTVSSNSTFDARWVSRKGRRQSKLQLARPPERVYKVKSAVQSWSFDVEKNNFAQRCCFKFACAQGPEVGYILYIRAQRRNRDRNRSVFNKPKNDRWSVFKRSVFSSSDSGQF
jgi:hypothetical protein